MKRSEERKKNVGNRKDIHSLISVSIHVCMSKKGKKRSVDYIILFEAISCPTNRVKKYFFRKIICRLRKKRDNRIGLDQCVLHGSVKYQEMK